MFYLSDSKIDTNCGSLFQPLNFNWLGASLTDRNTKREVKSRTASLLTEAAGCNLGVQGRTDEWSWSSLLRVRRGVVFGRLKKPYRVVTITQRRHLRAWVEIMPGPRLFWVHRTQLGEKFTTKIRICVPMERNKRETNHDAFQKNLCHRVHQAETNVLCKRTFACVKEFSVQFWSLLRSKQQRKWHMQLFSTQRFVSN